ncbi:MAG: carboxypeptidase regulatory-like domain-containing protein, partial [Acidobacteriaceae bacterium]|nr:carboxypeptidase regulatory-like domain-containing protein [Acidobacteriaceae bacterium]
MYSRTVLPGHFMQARLTALLPKVPFICIAVLATQPLVNGQGLTGQVSGRVQDPSNSVVTGVDVVLTGNVTGQKRATKTNSVGEFLFPEVLPGGFDLRVESAGFKTYEQKGAVLFSGEHLVLDPITLELGSVSETVVV